MLRERVGRLTGPVTSGLSCSPAPSGVRGVGGSEYEQHLSQRRFDLIVSRRGPFCFTELAAFRLERSARRRRRHPLGTHFLRQGFTSGAEGVHALVMTRSRWSRRPRVAHRRSTPVGIGARVRARRRQGRCAGALGRSRPRRLLATLRSDLSVAEMPRAHPAMSESDDYRRSLSLFGGDERSDDYRAVGSSPTGGGGRGRRTPARRRRVVSVTVSPAGRCPGRCPGRCQGLGFGGRGGAAESCSCL